MFLATPQEQLKELKRGLVDFVSETELLKKLEKSYDTKTPLKVKLGCDPSRPDLHLGHVVVLRKLKQFQDFGHTVQFLVGDFTARIGDPSGKSETRPVLTDEEIVANSKTYASQVFKILDESKTKVLFNYDWFKGFSSVDLVGLAQHYTVARMLERDDFNQRFKSQQPIAIHEFLYPLVQGYDSVVMKSDVELGGTDQLFNLLMGRDLQKVYGQAPQVIMTVPILEGLDGVQKMSKSLGNYIAVEDSPKDMFGKTMKLSDELMIRYYELLTERTGPQIEKLKQQLKKGEVHPRDAKADLGQYFVRQFHGDPAAVNALDEFNRMFQKKGLPDDMPEHCLKVQEDLWVCRFLLDLKMVTSTSEARRMIQQNAVEMRGERLVDPKAQLSLVSGDEFIVKVGKKKFSKVRVL